MATHSSKLMESLPPSFPSTIAAIVISGSKALDLPFLKVLSRSILKDYVCLTYIHLL